MQGMGQARARYDFSSSVAVVTGGANGIGAQVASRLRDCGAKVAIWDLQPAADFPSWHVDVTNRAGVEQACAQTIETLGEIDILVHSAGFAGPTVALDEYDPEVWERIVQAMIAKSPMQRLADPDEVAELALWLCSASCSFNAGAVFDLSGGRATY